MEGSNATETQRHWFGSDRPVGICVLVRIGAARYYPPAKQAFDGPKAKNQKPPSGKKLGAARVCDPLGIFLHRERGGLFSLQC